MLPAIFTALLSTSLHRNLVQPNKRERKVRIPVILKKTTPPSITFQLAHVHQTKPLMRIKPRLRFQLEDDFIAVISLY